MKHARQLRQQPIACVVVASLLLLGCHAASPTPASPPVSAAPPPALSGQVPEVISFACDQNRRAYFEPLLNQFHAQNPDITVQFVAIEDTPTGKKLGSDLGRAVQGLAGDADTHCFPLTTSAINTGVVRDLTPFMTTDTTFAPDDFFPGLLDAYRYRAAIWAVPRDVRLKVLYYREGAFKAADLPNPRVDWGLDAFTAAVERLTLQGTNETTQFGVIDHFGDLRQAWAAALVAAADQAHETLSGKTVQDGLRRYAELMAAAANGRPGDDANPGNQEGLALIAQDRVAMYVEVLVASPTQYGFAEGDPKHKIGLALLATPAGPKAGALVRGYWMSAGTTHPGASWRWLRFLTYQRPGGSAISQFILPPRQSTATSTGYWQQFDPSLRPVAEQAARQLAIAGLDPRWTHVSSAMAAVLRGEAPDTAAESAEELWQKDKLTAERIPAATVAVQPMATPLTGQVCTFALPAEANHAALRQTATAFGESQAGRGVQLLPPAEAAQADSFVSQPMGLERVLNLQPLIDEGGMFGMEQFAPQALAAFRHGGSLFGIPWQAQARVLYYNRQLFDQAGVAYPKPGWRLTDFSDAAVRLTSGAGEGKQYGFVALNGPAGDLPAFLAAMGAWPWDQAGRPRFDRPEVAAAIQWSTNLILREAISPHYAADWPGPDAVAQAARMGLVRAGRVAMWTDFTGIDRRQVWPAGNDIGMAPLPVGKVAATQFLWDGIMISAQAPDPRACWVWVRYLVEQPDLIRDLPANPAWLEAPAVAARLTPEAVATYRALYSYQDASMPSTSEAAAQWQWLAQAVGQILAGADVQAALSAAQAKAEGK